MLGIAQFSIGPFFICRGTTLYCTVEWKYLSKTALMKHHINLILNQFPPLKRKPLLRWFSESEVGRKSCHQAFLACLQEVSASQPELDRRSKIAFSLVHEFGLPFSKQTLYKPLIDAVEERLIQKSHIS